MALPKHSEITDSTEIHVPKGFTEALLNSAPSKNKNGELEWRDIDNWGARANFNAAVDPTPADDVNRGYSPGSRWLNLTNHNYFICVDATANSAVWRETTNTQAEIHIPRIDNPHQVTKAQVGLGNVENVKTNLQATVDPTIHDDSAQGYSLGSLWINTTTVTAFICVDPTAGAARWATFTVNPSAQMIGIDHRTLSHLDSDDHLQYLRVDGTRAVEGNLDLGENSVVNVDQVNGVNVEAHAARHLPQGEDPLPTAAPTTNNNANNSNSAGVANSLSRSDHSHAVDTATAITQPPDRTNSPGVSGSLARADHVHNIPTDLPITQHTDQPNAKGTSTAFARADHSHNIPTDTAVGLNANSANGQGSASTFSRADHTHAVASAPPVTQLTDQTNSPGTSVGFAKADHVHNIPTGLPSQITPNLLNAQGGSTSFSRQDHIHNLPTAAPVTQNPDIANADGSAASFSRSDHTHTIPTAAPITQQADQPNARGNSSSFARSDHAHNIPTAPAVSVGPSNSQGSSPSLSKADHVHQGIHSLSANSGPARFNDQNLKQGSGIVITDDGNGNFSFETNGAANELFVTIGTGLTVNYSAGKVRFNGTLSVVAAGFLLLPASTTGGQIYCDMDGTVKVGASVPPYAVPLASFTTNATTVTLLTDTREFLNHNPNWGLAADYSPDLPDNSASAGMTNRYAMADHQHANSTAAPVTQGPDNGNAKGTSTSFSRADHGHNIPTAAPVTQGPDQANSKGSSANFSRSDHVHNIPSAAPVTQTPDQVNGMGVSTSFSRADHTHNVPTDVPVSTGTANAQGASAKFARADHVHNTVLTRLRATGSTNFTANQSSDTAVTGMTLTPAAGVYEVDFHCQISLTITSSGSPTVNFSIYQGTTKIADSVRTISFSGNSNGNANQVANLSVSLSAELTLDGVTAITVQVNGSGGGGVISNRTLRAIRVG